MKNRRHETTAIATSDELRSCTPVAVPAVNFVPANPAIRTGRGALGWLLEAAATILRGAIVFALAANAVGCATTTATKAHPSPRAQAAQKCMVAEDAGRPTPPACAELARDVAGLRLLTAMAGR